MSRTASIVLGLAVFAAVLITSEGLVLWAQFSTYFGLEAWRVVSAMGAPLLLLVATLVAARSYPLRTVAAGVMIGVGVLTVWSAAWRLTWPDVGATYMLSMVGGLVATGTGVALLYVQNAAPRDSSATYTEDA